METGRRAEFCNPIFNSSNQGACKTRETMRNCSALRLLRIGLFLAALLSLPVWHVEAAAPQIVMSSNIDKPVTAGSSTTYLDLLKLIFPDLYSTSGETSEAMANKTVPVRHIDGDHAEEALEGDINFNLFVVLPIRSQGRELLLLQIDPKITNELEDGRKDVEERSLLALCQNGSPPKLLDVMDIKSDRSNGFWSKNPIVKLNSATDAFLICNTHHNSNQQYTTIRMLFVNENRLQEICSIFALDLKTYCESFASTPVFWTVPSAGEDYPKVVASIKLKMEPSPSDCKPRIRGFTKKFRAEFRWDKVKKQYKQTSANAADLKWLDKFYEEHF